MIREYSFKDDWFHLQVFDQGHLLMAQLSYYKSPDKLHDFYQYVNYGMSRLMFRNEYQRFQLYIGQHIDDLREDLDYPLLFEDVY